MINATLVGALAGAIGGAGLRALAPAGYASTALDPGHATAAPRRGTLQMTAGSTLVARILAPARDADLRSASASALAAGATPMTRIPVPALGADWRSTRASGLASGLAAWSTPVARILVPARGGDGPSAGESEERQP